LTQNAGNALLEAEILKVSRGSMPPDPPEVQGCGAINAS